MFSGIVEDLGTVKNLRLTDQGARITIRTKLALQAIKIGASIAVNGACLTVIAKANTTLAMEISAETLRRTNLGQLVAGARVNLERSLRLDSLLNGHLVSGHVDGVGHLTAIKAEGDSRLLTFEVAPAQARYLVEKGSVAVDGVSLTAFGINGHRFSSALIPHTLAVTTLGLVEPGTMVNIENDLVAKYIERFVTPPDPALNGRKSAKAAALGKAGFGGNP